VLNFLKVFGILVLKRTPSDFFSQGTFVVILSHHWVRWKKNSKDCVHLPPIFVDPKIAQGGQDCILLYPEKVLDLVELYPNANVGHVILSC
jgi:hypothetical protein